MPYFYRNIFIRFLTATAFHTTAWITLVAKSDVWIAITFSLLMQMPRFTYHFNLLFKAVPNLVQNIAFEKNIPVPTYVPAMTEKLRIASLTDLASILLQG